MKNFVALCLIILLSLGVNAQEGQILDNNGTEATLMVLDKESGIPVCRLSDQVRINSKFIPENRIGDVETTSIEDIRICQEDDVWDAVEEKMLVGVVIGPTGPIKNLISGTIPSVSTGIGTLICAFNDYGKYEKEAWVYGLGAAYLIPASLMLVNTIPWDKMYFNPVLGSVATLMAIIGIGACLN